MTSKVKKNKKMKLDKPTNICNHIFIIDLIDINPDKSQIIKYCTKCYLIDKLY
jgi:hypothetical protein